ncbi:MAG TPA: hypothetical protein VFE34_23655 [Dongiaceae bacterium]|jgi:hypothetical protein|nr:hypothetical protein [Dongiaceae bacterium]
MSQSPEPYGFPDDPVAEVRALSTYLARIKGGLPFPRRSDIRPEELPPSAFPRLFLVSVESQDDGAGETRMRFFYRLVGDRITHATGTSWTGRYLDEVVERSLGEIIAPYYEEAVKARQPLRQHYLFRSLRYEQPNPSLRYLFPLSEDGESIDGLLGLFLILEGPWARER